MTANLTSALASFHKAVGTIHKNSKAQYGSFASLADVLSSIAAPLADAGLAVTQTFIPAEGLTLLRTTLRHTSGETVESDAPLITVSGRNALHDWGGAVTYMRRFTLLAILNLAAGIEDDDGDSADAKPAAKKADAPKAKAVPVVITPAQTKIKPTAKEPAEEPEKIEFARDEDVKAIKSRIQRHARSAQIIDKFREFKGLAEGTQRISLHIQFPADIEFLSNLCNQTEDA